MAGSAGVTRLAELTHLDALGFPIFQAVRPRSRSLATAMGRGGSRRAAMASALLEAVETDVAEKIVAARSQTLAALGSSAIDVWHADAHDPLAVSLDLNAARPWIAGQDLISGEIRPVPFDLVSQDLTGSPSADALASTVGLATGGSRDEALASAIAELLEHDLEADWRMGTSADRRACEIDPATIDDPTVRSALDRVVRAGCDIRLWSLGQDWNVASILCFILDTPSSATRLPPVAGGGCYPDRTVATLRAIYEAAQARCALISGARDDLEAGLYREPRVKAVELLLSGLCFGPGPLAWSQVPTLARPLPAAAFAAVLAVARSRSSLPMIAVPLPSPHPSLEIVKVAAPGLRLSERAAPVPEPPVRLVIGRPRRGRRLMFVGPTLWSDELPHRIERRPPAAAGDLASLLHDPPEMIGLVDGEFETRPSVWHKEVLDLMAAGVIVYGAASIGALRAAELHADGMRGVGQVFDAYRSAMLRDDAVLLTHAPAELGYQPLTIALVDAEAAITHCARDPDERRMLQRIARTLSFRTRIWPTILAAFHQRTGRACTIGADAFAAAPSIKRIDALLLAETMCGDPERHDPPPRPPLTSYYRRLLARTIIDGV